MQHLDRVSTEAPLEAGFRLPQVMQQPESTCQFAGAEWYGPGFGGFGDSH